MAEDIEGECAMKWKGVGDEAQFQLGVSREWRTVGQNV
jgi:hypothetical protein